MIRMNDVENYSRMGLEKIKNVSILDKKDFVIMSDLSKELQRVFEVKQVFRTEVEIRYSVLDDIKFPTVQSKYWQSIREQDVFFTNLVYLSCDYEEKQGELDKLKIELLSIPPKNPTGKAEAKIKHAQIKRAQFQLMEMRIVAKDRVREIKVWEGIKNELKALKEFDINNPNTDQKESLFLRWKKQLDLAKQSGNAQLFNNSVTGLTTMENDKEALHIELPEPKEEKKIKGKIPQVE